MRVQVCEPRPIPEGYKFIRCDHYTPSQFKIIYMNSDGVISHNCLEYMKNNPKKIYTTDDRIAIHEMSRSREVNSIPRGTTKRYLYYGSDADNR